MRKLVVIAVLALLVPAAASARPPAPAPGPAATPLPPEQAAALVAAPAAAPDALTVQAVSPQQALAAASAPGAAVYVAPGLSLQQAVGRGSARPGRRRRRPRRGRRPSVGRVGRLLRRRRRRQLGHLAVRAADHVHGVLVRGLRRTTSPTTRPATNGGGTLCGVSWTSNQPISGGIRLLVGRATRIGRLQLPDRHPAGSLCTRATTSMSP